MEDMSLIISTWADILSQFFAGVAANWLFTLIVFIWLVSKIFDKFNIMGEGDNKS